MPSYNTNNSRNVEIYYSRDKKHWEQLFSQNNVYEDYESDNGIFVQLGEVGDRVYFRGKCDEFYTSTGPTGYIFGGTGKYATGGNPKSLYSFNCNIDTWDGMFESLFNSNFCPYIPVPGSNATFQSPLVDASQLVMPTELTKDCFQGMFESCKLLEHAPILHEVEFVPNYAYESMFHGCSSLKSVDFSIKATELGEYACYFMFGFSGLEEAPELDFLHMSKYCCSRMFENCKDLKEIPVFHNVDLSEYCFQSMFQSCTSLTEITRAFPVTQLAKWCYSSMFEYCSGLQTVSEDLLPATVLADYCYDSMFGYSGLMVAPNLPATVLANHCYGNMFSGSKLTAAPELPATTLANSCYYSMFSGCTSLTKAPKLPATVMERSCYMGMFKSCTSLVNAPDLPATELAITCYEEMFKGCTSLESIRVGFTEWPPYTDVYYQQNAEGSPIWGSTAGWFTSAKNATTCKIYKPAALETKRGNSYIPSKWEVYNLQDLDANI